MGIHTSRLSIPWPLPAVPNQTVLYIHLWIYFGHSHLGIVTVLPSPLIGTGSSDSVSHLYQLDTTGGIPLGSISGCCTIICRSGLLVNDPVSTIEVVVLDP